MINIEVFGSNLLKIDKKSYKNIDIYYIGYITIKDFDYVKINSVNPLYIIIDKEHGYVEEKNRNKYLVFASTDKNKEGLEKYTKLWDETKYLIKKINGGKEGEYGKDFMKIKIKKKTRFHENQEENKHYTQVFLDECLYEL